MVHGEARRGVTPTRPYHHRLPVTALWTGSTGLRGTSVVGTHTPCQMSPISKSGARSKKTRTGTSFAYRPRVSPTISTPRASFSSSSSLSERDTVRGIVDPRHHVTHTW